MAALQVMLFGGFDVRRESDAPVRLPTKKAQALLAYLATRPRQAHSRDKLASLLWGEKPDDQARGGLRQALAALRRALGDSQPPALRIEGRTLALDPDGVEVDVSAFERCIGEGTPSALEEAAALYRGDLLLGFTLNEPLFEEWLVAERERLREMALEGLARLLAHQTRSAATERGIQTAMRLLALDPLQEPVHRALMRLYGRQGRRGAALKQYQHCVAVLRRELGTEPEAETRRLYQELLRRSSEPAAEGEAPAARPPARAPVAPTASPDFALAETPLVGRDAEMERLRAALEEAWKGQGRAVMVTGEAGIGKTRLTGALTAAALERGGHVLIGRCHESDAILPFGPWVDALRRAEAGADAEALEGLAPRLRAELTRLLPEVGAPDLAPPSDSALGLFESVTALLEILTRRQPLMLVLEDLHWADEMSLRLLAYVARRIPGWPALLLGTVRDEELPDGTLARRTLDDLARVPCGGPIALATLSRADTAALVRALARAGTDTAAVAEAESRVWAMSEGNPFVVVEAMRAIDLGAPTSSPPALPASVRDLVGRRLDRLGPRAQELVALAAIIGRRCDFRLLHAASGMEEREAAEGVEEMVRGRVLQVVGDELELTHDRVREVAASRVLPPRRRLLHRAVAEALEAVAAPGEHVEALAHHALRGELREKAVRYLREAGERAVARAAIPEARASFEQALDVLATLPETRAALEAAVDLRLSLRSVALMMGELRKAFAIVGEAEVLARRMHDDARRGRALAFMTNIRARLNDVDGALANGLEAQEIADRLDDGRLRSLALDYLGQVYAYRGEYEEAVALASANLAAMPADRYREYFGGSLGIVTATNERGRLINSLAHLGRFAEGAAHIGELLAFAEATQHVYARSLAYHTVGVYHLIKGEWEQAHTWFDRQITALRGGGITSDIVVGLSHDARALAHLGKTQAALELVRECEAVLEIQMREGIAHGWSQVTLARACFFVGRIDEAQSLADQVLLPPGGRTDFIASFHLLRGDLASAPGRIDATRAAACYREALALAEARGMRPTIGCGHLALGQLAARVGTKDAAREHLHIAASMFREMEMPAWLEWAEGAAAVL